MITRWLRGPIGRCVEQWSSLPHTRKALCGVAALVCTADQAAVGVRESVQIELHRQSAASALESFAAISGPYARLSINEGEAMSESIAVHVTEIRWSIFDTTTVLERDA